MLRWRDLHPYCAAHVVDLATPLDTGRLATTIAGVLEAAGLTGLALDRRYGRYVFAGGPAQVALDVEPGTITAALVERSTCAAESSASTSAVARACSIASMRRGSSRR